MTLHTLTLHQFRQRLPKVDRAWIALAALLAGIAVFLPERFAGSLDFTVDSLIGIAPYLLVSVALAAYMKAAGAEHLIARVFTGSPLKMIVTASLFGALSPFCSCGVIPIIAALLTMGVPLAPVMAFWISSPVMSPDMFVLTASELGGGFAVAKTVAAFGLGMVGGFGTHWAQGAGLFSTYLREGVGDGGCAASSVHAPKETQWRFWKESARRLVFLKSSGDTGLFLLKWLTLAFVLESLMVHYLPPELVGNWLGGDSLWAIPLSVIVGVPAYLNGYAAIPVVAGLMSTGMAPGAALAFMTAGAVTSIPAAIAVFALVRKPVFGWYLLLALFGSALTGVLYQLVLSW